MIRGQRAGVVSRALDAYLATIADHGFNASTFTARRGLDAGRPDLGGAGGTLCPQRSLCRRRARAGARHARRIGEASRAEAWFDDAFARARP
jgi:citrate synthase